MQVIDVADNITIISTVLHPVYRYIEISSIEKWESYSAIEPSVATKTSNLTNKKYHLYNNKPLGI